MKRIGFPSSQFLTESSYDNYHTYYYGHKIVFKIQKSGSYILNNLMNIVGWAIFRSIKDTAPTLRIRHYRPKGTK